MTPIPDYTCNICGHENTGASDDPLRRCAGCQGSVRFRATAHVATTQILGTDEPLYRIGRRFPLRGFGLSDFLGYAQRLAQVCDYRNTFYTAPPRVDICNPPPEETGANDFMISADVFSHAPPPAAAAFAGAAKVLRRGGKLLVSMPVNPNTSQTLEHYPRLHDFTIEGQGEERVIVNRLAAGGVERYLHPKMHGGPGLTLEMRVFSLEHVLELLGQHGFGTPWRLAEPAPQYGITDLAKMVPIFVATRL